MNYAVCRQSLDINSPISQATFYVSKNDTGRKYYFILTEYGKPYTIADGCIAVLKAVKSDDSVIYNNCSIEDNTIIYELTAQTVAASAIVQCELILYGTDNMQLTAPMFHYVVRENLYSDEDITSTNEFSALRAALFHAENVNVSITKENGVTTITVTDREGVETVVTVEDGAKGLTGPQGEQGPKGEAGTSGIPVIVQQTDSTVAITPNVFNVWGEMTELNLSFGTPATDTINEYMFQFTSGTTATTLILPDTVKWVVTPTIETNKTYQCSIVNNIGLLVGA